MLTNTKLKSLKLKDKPYKVNDIDAYMFMSQLPARLHSGMIIDIKAGAKH
ncbi:hypothetical protein AAEX37_01631 [Oligella sp. MSHR50489EDL]